MNHHPKASTKLSFTITTLTKDDITYRDEQIQSYTKTHPNNNEKPSIDNPNPTLRFDQRSRINNYFNYITYITDMFSSPSLFNSELSYRLHSANPSLTISKLSTVDQYKIIGKIGSNRTKLDRSAYTTNSVFYNNNRKFLACSTNYFPTTRANNCVTSGKWCYEVVLLSNGLFQVGFSQLETPNTNSNGIGDDLTSYAYDGYRRVVYNKEPISYGMLWATGDVIGVCIDLTQGKERMEYFLNGKSMGYAFDGSSHFNGKIIASGKNVAYFPAVSCSSFERLLMNFGEVPFYYNYNGYEPFDLQSSRYDNSLMITAKIINAFNKDLLSALSFHSYQNNVNVLEFNLTNQQKIFINKIVFGYIINVSFSSIYICKDLLFPFLSNLHKTNQKQFNIFLDQVECFFKNNTNETDKKRIAFYDDLLDIITNLLEEYACIGHKQIKQWSRLMDLLIELWSIDHIFSIWRELNNTSFYISLLYNSSAIHIDLIYEEILKERKTNKYSRAKQLKCLLKNETITKALKDSYEDEKIYSEGISKFLYTLIIMSKKNDCFIECMKLLQSVLTEYFHMEDIEKDNTMISIMNKNKNNGRAIKNYIINMMQMYLENFGSIPLKDITSDSFAFKLLKYILILAEHVSKYINAFLTYYKKKKAYPDNEWKINQELSTEIIGSFYMQLFYIFNDYHQRILAQFSYYMIGFIVLNITQKTVSDIMDISYIFPGTVLMLLNKFHSKILGSSDESLAIQDELNNKCELFRFQGFLESNMFFLIMIMNHKNENWKTVMKMTSYFIQKKKYAKFFFNSENNKKYYITALFKHMGHFETEHISITNLISKTFTYENQNSFNHPHIDVIFNALEKTIKAEVTNLLIKFVDDKLTKFIFIYDNTLIKVNESFDYIHLMWFKRAYKVLCNALNVYRFAIHINESDWLDSPDSIISIKFNTLMVNITSRLINSVTIENIGKLREKYGKYNSKEKSRQMTMVKLRNAIVNLLGEVFPLEDDDKKKEKDAQDETKMNKLIDRIGGNEAINIGNIIALNKLCEKELQDNGEDNGEDNDASRIKAFEEMIEKMRIKQVEMKEMRRSVIGRVSYDEDECILCCQNKVNKKLLPCNHTSCSKCLTIYMIEYKTCFICRGNIESIVDY